jgi:gas vesicle protein
MNHTLNQAIMKSLPGILVGLAVGAIVGVLLAPESGKKTRKRISSESDSFFKDLQDQLQSGLDNIRSQYNDYVDSAVSKTQDAVSDVKKKAKY